MNTSVQTSIRLEGDLAKLKDAYDGEKLALVDALQALKNLVIQANPDLSVTALETLATSAIGANWPIVQDEDQPQSDDPRADLISAVAEVFEKEREVLIAELQTSVVEANIEAGNAEVEGRMPSAMPASLKTDALERKLNEQVSGV